MFTSEVKKLIMDSLKVEVTKSFDAVGNDNSKQNNSEFNNVNVSMFPLRLEDFYIKLSFELPEDLEEGAKTVTETFGLTIHKKTPLTMKEAKLFKELKQEGKGA
jgi:hypothetical protein